MVSYERSCRLPDMFSGAAMFKITEMQLRPKITQLPLVLPTPIGFEVLP